MSRTIRSSYDTHQALGKQAKSPQDWRHLLAKRDAKIDAWRLRRARATHGYVVSRFVTALTFVSVVIIAMVYVTVL